MGYIGEDITDGRWLKIEYDSIHGYYFYRKHQGHKETDCIIRKEMKKIKKRKELDKISPRKTVHKELHIFDNMKTGRREVDFNQQKYKGETNQQHMQQDDWKTQRRRNNKQQVKFNADRVVIQHQKAQMV